MLTAERLRELLAYDAATGVFTRRVSLTPSVRVGEIAGTAKGNGYRQINVDGSIYLAHVLAWLWMTGEMPPKRITFRNGDKGDTRWENLRLTGPEPKLTAERLREILYYDPGTGVFRYRRNRGGGKLKGDIAGFISPKSDANGGGYRIIAIEGREYGAHRLAWLYMTGAWPTGRVDHKNTIRDDNRFDNLREATHSQNMANKNLQANNTSGLKGVTWNKNARKWVASIQANGKQRHLGLFLTAKSAHDAYCRAAYELFGSFARIA
jgi:hypothetical protein